MIDKKDYFVREVNFKNIKIKRIKSSKYYKILFIFSGDCYVKQKKSSQICSTDNIILISPNNDIDIELKSKQSLIIYELAITTELLNKLSDEEVDLNRSFNTVPFECAVVDASTETTMLIKNILKKLVCLKEDSSEFANNLYIKSMLSIVLVLILRSCIYAEPKQKIKKSKPFLIDDIFSYINNHITEEISLDNLEKEFYVSKFHISREFKKATGITLHRYIVKAKLDLCKKLIEEGNTIIDVAQICGIGSYNNLFRAFKKEFGITPKEYYNEIKKYK
ncbi:AraC family transcriptional regulator [Romboutsia ilealis]|uniref:Helix-turn-helix transcriptional regulator n=1 Tax=Romboutsia faecis TaxID=2764597 RepID=A0ABR7JNU0_9FIRM|nr:AraC family transcriptional regulator [Romboutsia faecis]MBC5996601.1 helix-turn-helix transcriptional regulator [Romboutsia faecis]MRN24126.1 AraC family transcriptional regulator [Romboutsia ilealis]